MKTRKITFTLIILLSLTVITNAQPLPPTNPSGNPVPVENFLYLLPMLIGVLGYRKLSKKSDGK